MDKIFSYLLDFFLREYPFYIRDLNCTRRRLRDSNRIAVGSHQQLIKMTEKNKNHIS
jgi:hypothetical protein